MVRLTPHTTMKGGRFPHGCGDGPAHLCEAGKFIGFSPRVWGWSDRRHASSRRLGVFPTGVGMVRDDVLGLVGLASFPHGCGDGP